MDTCVSLAPLRVAPPTPSLPREGGGGKRSGRLVRRHVAVAALCAAVLGAVAGPAWAGYEESAVLEALDKVTGRVFKLEVALESEVEFGALRIVARSCYKTPPEETPESTAFLEISEVKPGEQPVLLFKGWMFASSPGLSTLEHPTYDVIVLDCAPAPLTAKEKASYFVDPMPSEAPPESPRSAPSSE